MMATPLHSVVATGEGIAMSDAPLSFDGFFQDQYTRLFATLCLTTGSWSDAEELTQDAFVCVLERWDRVGGLEEPAGFLYRTAMNLFKRRYRRARTLDRLPIRSEVGDVLLSLLMSAVAETQTRPEENDPLQASASPDPIVTGTT